MECGYKLAIAAQILLIFMKDAYISATCTEFVEQVVPTFMQCQYRCHCKEDKQCDETTGECSNGCKFGWMGPGCQYRNIAENSNLTQMVDSGEYDQQTSEKAVDGNDATCSKTVATSNKTQKWYMQFNRTYEVIGLILKVPSEDVEKFRNFVIKTSDDLNGTRFPTTCYQHTNTPINTTMEIMCKKPTKMRQLLIKLDISDVPLSLCEVEIYGGRSITFNKPAHQISTYTTPNKFSWNASRALDGRAAPDNSSDVKKACSATKYEESAWWSVDLGALYILYEAQFFGRLNTFHQFQGFHLLYGQNNSTFSELYHDTSTSDDKMTYQPLKIPINTTVNARFLKVQLNNPTDKKVLLAICEVIAFAECQSNQCGWDCSMKCSCSSEITGSYKVAGTCPNGCLGRWTGVGGKCDTECELTDWGTHCGNKCGHCKGNPFCNVTTGKCEEGCSGPWKPPLCIEECSNFTYGINCSLNCGKCKNLTSCNTTDGTCADGCEPGWEPPTCNEQCQNRTYGYNCQYYCGKCSKQPACDIKTGECHDGCESGYRTQYCNEKCDSGTYGSQCALKCGHCLKNESCHFQTGICVEGCSPGYQNNHCNDTCDSGTYGSQCALKCGHCLKNESCHFQTGICVEGCSSGYQNNHCNDTCDSGTYGSQCALKCGHCLKNESCHFQTGICVEGCSPGYQNNHCNDTCDHGTYGNKCEQTCGFCSGSETCDAVTGVCHSCKTGYTGTLCIKEVPAKTEHIIGTLAAVLGVIFVAIIIAVVIIRKRRKPKKDFEEMVPAVSKSEVVSSAATQPLCRSDNQKAVRRHNEATIAAQDDNVYGNTVADKHDIIVARLRMVAKCAKTAPEPFFEDFKEIPYSLTSDTSVAKRHKNKNKYSDMYPYNFNRVVLPPIENVPDSTYINASYINGCNEQKKYIASQGAIKSTIDDFWRMVWSHKVKTIVMLTNCTEAGKSKCEQYWPNDHLSHTYRTITVDWTSSDVFTYFCIRTFRLTTSNGGEQRTVIQFHYTAWPDKDVPDTALSLVQFWRAVRQNQASKTIPWVVHCSAGVGRTGTFIGLDLLYERGDAEGVVNIKGGVNTLREQRVKMVQTKEQYVLLHEALAEVLDPIGSVYKSEQFINHIPSLISNTGAPTQALRDEYQAVCDSCETEAPVDDENVYYNVTDKAIPAAGNPINLHKSRCPDIYPDDLHRPMLSRIPIQGHNEFINAVFVSAFRQHDRLILTQVPLEDTIQDFVRMLWDTNVSTVVLLEADIDEEFCYWPLNTESINIGPIQCELMEEKQYEHYIVRTLKYITDVHYIQEKEKVVRQFHFKSWFPERSTPESTRSILGLVSGIEENICDNHESQIVFQCMDGATRSGLLCVLWCVLDRMKTEREIGIAETVRLCRKRRRQVIANLDQYAFCYKVLNDYLENVELYSNVL